MQKILLISLMTIGSLTLFSDHFYTVQQEGELPSSEVSLGHFSMSLAVKDLDASAAFYQQLGFEPFDNINCVAGKWLILKRGTHKIGLFQDIIPKNTLTFNPKDARALHQEFKAKEFETIYSQGLEQAEGPCSFMLSDPDGNPILFDQF